MRGVFVIKFIVRWDVDWGGATQLCEINRYTHYKVLYG